MGKMAWWTKYQRHKHEDLSSNPQHPLSSHSCDPSEMEGGDRSVSRSRAGYLGICSSKQKTETSPPLRWKGGQGQP